MRKLVILIPEKNFPKGKGSQCKGPEAQICLLYFRMIKEISGWRRKKERAVEMATGEGRRVGGGKRADHGAVCCQGTWNEL